MRIIIICILCASVSFAIQFGYRKHEQTAQTNRARERFFQVQEDFLFRISKVLAYSVKLREVAAINQHLAAYEEVLFTLHQPVNLQVAILDAPMQVIGLFPELAPDQNYYSQLLQDPKHLAYSHTYTKSAMPDYPLLNYGVGILDQNGTVLGVVEARIPESVLQELINSQVPGTFYREILWLAVWHVLLIATAITAIWLLNKYRSSNTKTVRRLQDFIDMQHRYTSMSDIAMNFNIMQIVGDVYAAIAIGMQRAGVEIIFPHDNTQVIYCYCQPKELVQTLTDIANNIARQLGANGRLQLEITLDNNLVNFIFTDNGFYNQLDPAWGDLKDNIQYLHTAYVGNKIVYSVPRIIKNNVISLEQFQEV